MSAVTESDDFPTRDAVLSGLIPTAQVPRSTNSAGRRAGRVTSSGVLATLPVVLAGSMALSGAIAPVAAAPAENDRKTSAKPDVTIRPAPGTAPVSATPADLRPAAVPSSYRVQRGDTVSGIAGRFGVSTASVLAANGLGWTSLIHPGQVLTLAPAASAPATPAPPRSPARYTIVAGDTISGIAAKYGFSTATLLAANNLTWTSIIHPGQTIVIPGAAAAPTASPVVEPTTPVVSAPAAPVSSTYVIRPGDTVTGIAARFGVTVPAVLRANGLSRSSTIYIGRTLTIPAIDVAAADAGVTPLTDEMRANARLIVAVGAELGVPERGVVVALAAAMQESSLRNINFGDRDSVGVFQQRPSAGWGTAEELLNVTHAARLFFGGPTNPNRGVTRGLLDIPDWQSRTINAAAQAVQVSAHPEAYGKWENSARAWVAELR